LIIYIKIHTPQLLHVIVSYVAVRSGVGDGRDR